MPSLYDKSYEKSHLYPGRKQKGEGKRGFILIPFLFFVSIFDLRRNSPGLVDT